MNRATISLVAALFTAAAAAAAPAPELKGITLGQSRDSIMSSPTIVCSSTWSRENCTWSTTIASTPAKFFVQFDEAENVSSVLVNEIDSDGFGDVVAGLVSKFGKPTSTRKSTVKNLTGATLPSTTLIWKFKGWSIVATERDGKMLEGSIFMRLDAQPSRPSPASDM